MSEIPDDIKAAGRECAARMNTAPMFRGYAAMFIADAILAERERCAKIAEGFWNAGGPSFKLTANIASTIRGPA